MVVMVNQTSFLFCGASYSPAIDITYDWWHNSYKIMFVKVRSLGNAVFVYNEPHYTRVSGGSTEPSVCRYLVYFNVIRCGKFCVVSGEGLL